MLRRVRFFSDDSYGSHREAVTAGVAIEMDRANVRNALLEAERISGKGLKDWHRTSPSQRISYIEAALEIPGIHSRIFFRAFDSLENDEKWKGRVYTLAAAIDVFTPGSCHHEMYPEGLKSGSRYQLRRDLKNLGCDRVTVESADFLSGPEVRFADALAGYIRGELYRDSNQRVLLDNLPDGFEDLDPEKRNPSDYSEG